MGRKESMKHFLKTVFVWFFLFLIIYLGAGAYIGADLHVTLTSSKPSKESSSTHVFYKGVDFESEKEVKEIVKRESAGVYFPWVFSLPLEATVFVLAFCSGAFGGIIKIFKELSINKRKIAEMPVTYLLFFAGFLGLMVLGVSYLLPAALTASKNIPQPVAIVFLSILGGIFCENTMEWLEKQYKKIFNK